MLPPYPQNWVQHTLWNQVANSLVAHNSFGLLSKRRHREKPDVMKMPLPKLYEPAVADVLKECFNLHTRLIQGADLLMNIHMTVLNESRNILRKTGYLQESIRLG